MNTVFLLIMSLAAMLFQGLPHASPRDAARQIVDNDVFTVWDVTWAGGRRTPAHSHENDSVSIYLAGGAIRVTSPDGASRVVTHNPGEAAFEAKGGVYGEENTSENSPVRAIVVNLKSRRDPPLQNVSGYPNAFPRPGVKKILENDRVVVWDYTWTTGAPTPVHFHDKYVVVVYLEDGAVKSTTLDGNSVVNEISFGLATANPRARVHTEEVVRGKARAIIMELK